MGQSAFGQTLGKVPKGIWSLAKGTAGAVGQAPGVIGDIFSNVIDGYTGRGVSGAKGNSKLVISRWMNTSKARMSGPNPAAASSCSNPDNIGPPVARNLWSAAVPIQLQTSETP